MTLEIVRLVLGVARGQRRRVKLHVLRSRILPGDAPRRDHRNLIQTLEALAGYQRIDVVGKPNARGAGHSSDLTDLVAEGLFRLLVHTALRNPETDDRGQKEG